MSQRLNLANAINAISTPKNLSFLNAIRPERLIVQYCILSHLIFSIHVVFLVKIQAWFTIAFSRTVQNGVFAILTKVIVDTDASDIAAVQYKCLLALPEQLGWPSCLRWLCWEYIYSWHTLLTFSTHPSQNSLPPPPNVAVRKYHKRVIGQFTIFWVTIGHQSVYLQSFFLLKWILYSITWQFWN